MATAKSHLQLPPWFFLSPNAWDQGSQWGLLLALLGVWPVCAKWSWYIGRLRWFAFREMAMMRTTTMMMMKQFVSHTLDAYSGVSYQDPRLINLRGFSGAGQWLSLLSWIWQIWRWNWKGNLIFENIFGKKVSRFSTRMFVQRAWKVARRLLPMLCSKPCVSEWLPQRGCRSPLSTHSGLRSKNSTDAVAPWLMRKPCMRTAGWSESFAASSRSRPGSNWWALSLAQISSRRIVLF